MPLRDLDNASLALFRAVCGAGSITRGAQDFGLALGAASRRIGELERSLGARLLVRGKSGARPTAAGAALLEHIDRLSHEADRLDLSLADFRLGIETRVRVWANTSAVNGFLPRRMAAFARAYPAIRIELDEAFSDAIVQGVAEGRTEIGIYAATAPSWGLHVAICDTHRLVAITPRSHPIASRKRVWFDELLQHDFVGLTRGTALQNQLDAEAAKRQKPLRLRVQVRSYDAVAKIVSEGLGVSLVPQQVAELLARPLGLAAIPLADAWGVRNLVAAVRSLEELAPAARAFFDRLVQPPAQ